MVGRKTTFDDHSDLAEKLFRNFESFIDEIGRRGCTMHFQSVLDNDKYLKGKDLGQKPERFIEDHLIFPVLRSLGHSILPRPVRYAPKWEGVPDFCLTTIPISTAKENHIRIFGESKTPNKLKWAREDVDEYLNNDLDFHAITFLTDGIEWEMWLRHRKEPIASAYSPYAVASFRKPIQEVSSRNFEKEDYRPHRVRDMIDVDSFSSMTDDGIRAAIHDEFGVTLN